MLQKNIEKLNRKNRKTWLGLYTKIEKSKKTYSRKNKHKDKNYIYY